MKDSIQRRQPLRQAAVNRRDKTGEYLKTGDILEFPDGSRGVLMVWEDQPRVILEDNGLFTDGEWAAIEGERVGSIYGHVKDRG